MSFKVWHSSQPTFAERPVRLALFDLDGTLVVSKSGKRWAADADDWVFRGNVPAVLQRYATEGWTVAIVSNQSEMSKPRTAPILTSKIESVLTALFAANAWAPWCLVATGAAGEAVYRKPARGLYDELLRRLDHLTIAEVTMCGDAVGAAAERPEYRWSDSDAAFARTIGATFRTPDEVFVPPAIEPRVDSQREVAILVGNMGSGKSTTARRLAAAGYIHCEQDVLGNARGVLRAATAALREGKSVVVEATHSTAEHREPYLTLARTLGAEVRILWHIRDGRPYNALRPKPVPEVAYSVYSKRFEDPRICDVPVQIVF